MFIYLVLNNEIWGIVAPYLKVLLYLPLRTTLSGRQTNTTYIYKPKQ